MSSQFPDLKNEMEKIAVPLDKLDAIIANTVHDTKMKKTKRRIALYSVNAALVGFGLFLGTAMVSPAMAKVASSIPVVGTFFNDIGDDGLRIAGQKGLTQMVGQSSKDNGITLTVNEIFYDGTRLAIGFTQESLLAIGELERPTIEVDGKEINFSAGSSGEFRTPQKYSGKIDINPTEELPEEFDIKVKFDAVGVIPGKWEFAFPVKQSNQVLVIRPNETKLMDDAEVTISSLKLGPAGTDLAVKVIADKTKSGIDPYQLEFHIVDDQGNVLDTLSGSGYGETVDGKEVATLDFLYAPLDEGVKSIRVTPYTRILSEKTPEEDSVLLENQELPFSLDQGELGNVLIKEIEYLNDKMIVYFDIQSDGIIDNHASFNSIWLKDASGTKLVMKDTPTAERIQGNSFKQEFPTGKKKGLKLATYKGSKPVVYEEFVIDLK